ncbi:arginyl-tRNA synthetase [Metarhizium acridum CQMa 102]|uniref:arginine--tRNA ligase n=1 Tax=Metarhizium acridum (strain CQMa 102) TaxID=655827 RepID=E9EIF0_METAQ|nr:arginyl-tRNA synthetase [Metarhizium acridum CQMa 102]EFY84312.1 arginyl-tRNA synthetase [Metarhizium acridum CQMa 102]
MADSSSFADPLQGPLSTIYPAAFPYLNPLDRFRIAIAEELSIITGADRNLIFDSLDRSTSLNKGDLLLAVPRLRVKNSLPIELTHEVVAKSKPQRPKASLLSFMFNPKELPSALLPTILQLRDDYGFNTKHGLRDPADAEAGKKTVIIEFSSPNIAKKFHAGHLRSTIIGGFLSNLYEKSGYIVVRTNYLGDWGRQYGLLACGWKRYGDEVAFAQDPIGHLFDIYVKISADFEPEEEAFKAAGKRGEDTSLLESRGILGEAKAYFKQMEDGDELALELWRRFRELSIKRYQETYARLNIHFDVYSGESQVKKETMEKAEDILKHRHVIELTEGAWAVDFKKYGTKGLDVAIIRNRQWHVQLPSAGHRRGSAERRGGTHLNRLFKILSLMGDPYNTLAKKMKHVSYGKVNGMSTRKGTVKFLDDILADVGDFMHDIMRRNEQKYSLVDNPTRTAEILGISAIMVQDMSGKRINNYDFDLDRMTSFEGDTGPYLQYAHARLCSIFRKVDFTVDEMLKSDFSLLSQSPHAIGLLRVMAQFPDLVNHALKTLEPTTILTYLFKLTHKLSSSYDHLRVVEPTEGPAMSLARASLYYGARQVLRNGMVLLGITPIDR